MARGLWRSAGDLAITLAVVAAFGAVVALFDGARAIVEAIETGLAPRALVIAMVALGVVPVFAARAPRRAMGLDRIRGSDAVRAVLVLAGLGAIALVVMIAVAAPLNALGFEAIWWSWLAFLIILLAGPVAISRLIAAPAIVLARRRGVMDGLRRSWTASRGQGLRIAACATLTVIAMLALWAGVTIFALVVYQPLAIETRLTGGRQFDWLYAGGLMLVVFVLGVSGAIFGALSGAVAARLGVPRETPERAGVKPVFE